MILCGNGMHVPWKGGVIVNQKILSHPLKGMENLSIISNFAGIAQLVERNLAKVEVASSRLVSRSKYLSMDIHRDPWSAEKRSFGSFFRFCTVH